MTLQLKAATLHRVVANMVERSQRLPFADVCDRQGEFTMEGISVIIHRRQQDGERNGYFFLPKSWVPELGFTHVTMRWYPGTGLKPTIVAKRYKEVIRVGKYARGKVVWNHG